MKDLIRRLDSQSASWWRFPRAAIELRRRERKLASGGPRPKAASTIVSLATMSARLPRAHFALRSLLAQTVLPKKIVVYLSEEELGGKTLPLSLRSLGAANDLLEFRFLPNNHRSYNKIIPALKDFDDDSIVTADDDVIYPLTWLETLLAGSRDEPAAIICHWARKLPLSLGARAPDYKRWPNPSGRQLSHHLLPIGVGGVLYPPGSLHPDVCKPELFLNIAPDADDFWLRFMSLRKATPVLRIDAFDRLPPPIPSPWASRLSVQNLHHGGNLEVFARLMQLYGEELRETGLLAADH